MSLETSLYESLTYLLSKVRVDGLTQQGMESLTRIHTFKEGLADGTTTIKVQKGAKRNRAQPNSGVPCAHINPDTRKQCERKGRVGMLFCKWHKKHEPLQAAGAESVAEEEEEGGAVGSPAGSPVAESVRDVTSFPRCTCCSQPGSSTRANVCLQSQRKASEEPSEPSDVSLRPAPLPAMKVPRPHNSTHTPSEELALAREAQESREGYHWE